MASVDSDHPFPPGRDMASYPIVRNALQIFSIEVGLDDEGALETIRQSLADPEYRARLQNELTALVTDPTAPWRDLVANDFYEIDEADDDDQAREIVLALLWEAVFPELGRLERNMLDPSKVPAPLREYIPYADLWGIADDLQREWLVDHASEASKRELVDLIASIDDDLDDWLAGPEAGSPNPTREYLAFSAMRMAADFI